MRQVLCVFLGVCLFLTGCDDSTTPLSDAAKARPDKELIGVWQQKSDSGTTYHLVGLLGDKAPAGVMRVVGLTQTTGGELYAPSQMLLFPTEIAGNRYLNLTDATQEQLASLQKTGWKADLFDSYFLLKYRVEGDTVLVWPMNPDAKKKAIEAGKIKGEITKGKDGTRIRFTDTPEHLAQFVAAAGASLFSDKPLRFERIR